MRIAIVVGHSFEDGGAVRCVDGVQEHAWNTDLAEMIAAHDPKNIKIFHRKGSLPYKREIEEVYARVDAWGCDLSIEPHFNAGGGTGTETFSSGSKGSLKAAAKVHAAIVKTLGLKDRGVKIRNATVKGRGYESLVSGKAPALLLEPYFGDNAGDCAVADNNKKALAAAIYLAAVGC